MPYFPSFSSLNILIPLLQTWGKGARPSNNPWVSSVVTLSMVLFFYLHSFFSLALISPPKRMLCQSPCVCTGRFFLLWLTMMIVFCLVIFLFPILYYLYSVIVSPLRKETTLGTAFFLIPPIHGHSTVVVCERIHVSRWFICLFIFPISPHLTIAL